MKTILTSTYRHLKKIDSVGYISYEMFPHWVRLSIWALGLEAAPYRLLMSRLMVVWRASGSTYVVSYTKECTRILHAFVSGRPELVTHQFIVGLKAGLPSIIPGSLRSRIRGGDLGTIRGVLTLFAVYRIIKIPGVLKLETITGPFSGLCETLPKYEIIKSLSELKRVNNPPRLCPVTLKCISTAGPNHPTSMLGIWFDILAWREAPAFPALRKYLKWAEGGEDLLKRIDDELAFLSTYEGTKVLHLSRLSLKEEAAGKVRVFAIMDSITQTVMSPLSDYVFSILKSLPMDGTFDQSRPVRHLEDAQVFSKGSTLYSYDLSAATDRLPITLQTDVLSCLFGQEVADLWREILINREYVLRKDSSPTGEDMSLRYSVGQPMGALSSWAMLALTHHVIVRIAARRMGKPFFTDYALLGDDIVIADYAVAQSYHGIMTQILGVDINLMKSMVSNTSFEFAKRIITNRGEVTPVGPKNLLVGLRTPRGLPSILIDLWSKGLALTQDRVTELFNSVPTIRKSDSRRWAWLVKGPFGFVPTVYGFSPFAKVNNSLYTGNHWSIPRLLKTIWKVNILQAHRVWIGNVSRSWDTILKLEALDRIERLDGVSLHDSPLRLHILDTYYAEFSKLLSSEPLPAPYPGFATFSDSRDPVKISEKISSFIKDDSLTTFSVLDPWSVDKVVLPLQESRKVQSFWTEVMGEQEQGGRFGPSLPFSPVVKAFPSFDIRNQ